VHNVSEIYKVPLVLQKQNVAEIISDKLQMYLPKGMPNIADWENLCRRLDGVEHKVPAQHLIAARHDRTAEPRSPWRGHGAMHSNP
jgi:CTP synthase (UTP-ammonia lyase)